MKFFITGGCGFIGTYITKKLVKQGNEVTCFDSFLNYVDPSKSMYPHALEIRLKYLNESATVVRGDIRNKSQLMNAIKKANPEMVIHLAAIPIATKANEFPEDSHTINLMGTANVLECLRELGTIKRFIYTSSSFVYGDFDYEPADEKHATKPIDIYGGTKLAGEILTKAYGNKFGVDYTIIRPSAVYGPTDANRRVTEIFLRNALAGKPLKLFNGGAEKVDFTYVSDVANGYVLAAKSEKAKNETLNITRGDAKTIKELAEVIKKFIPDIKIEESESDMRRPKRGSLDIKKAKELIGYEPKINLEQGIEKYLKGIKENILVE